MEGAGFWIRYLVVMAVLIFVARAFWLAARDEREARRWSDERRCLDSLRQIERKR